MDALPQEVRDLLPEDDASQQALALAVDSLPPPILNHSLRVYLLSLWLAERESTPEWPEWWAISASQALPLLFVSCILHDLGACLTGAQRFEVVGADAAKEHCLTHGIKAADAHMVWTAIALHTTAGIAERIDPLTRLVRLGVKCDFSPPEVRDSIKPGARERSDEIERFLPRLEIERVLADAVVSHGLPCEDRVVDKGGKWWSSDRHPKASWPGILMRAHLENPSHEGWVNGENPAF